MPSEKQRAFLWEQAQTYRKALPGSPGEEYLRGRGLSDDRLASLGVGYVQDPPLEHEHYQGCLAIPYMRWSPRSQWSCISMRFRCISSHEHKDFNHGKYMSNDGDSPHLYNARELLKDRLDIGLTEGEFDAQSVILGGLPAVGIPGTQTAEKWWWDAFEGYENVYLFVDGDEAGKKFAREVRRVLGNVRFIEADHGMDANDMMLKYGAGWYQERLQRG